MTDEFPVTSQLKASSAIYGIGSDSFGAILILARFATEDFSLTATPVPASLNLPPDSLAGWVTVKRRSTGTARTYNAGPGHDWLSFFKRDLVAGIFGGPGGHCS